MSRNSIAYLVGGAASELEQAFRPEADKIRGATTATEIWRALLMVDALLGDAVLDEQVRHVRRAKALLGQAHDAALAASR